MLNADQTIVRTGARCMLTKIRVLRALLVGVAVGAVAAAAMMTSNRSGGSTPQTPVAATTRAAAEHTTGPNGKTNVGGDTHGSPSGATFNGNDQGTADPPTPGLNALFRGITVKARSVSAVVHAPAGLAVTNTTEISVLFGNRRVSQNYDRKAGTTITFNYPVGDGKRRNEVLTVNLTERAPGGAVPYHWNRLAVIEPEFEVTISDLTFTLLNDCDPVGDSEPNVGIADDRGVVQVELSMSADEARHLHQLSRHVTAAKVSDGLVVPQLSFVEEDLNNFHGPPSKPLAPALLPGASRQVRFEEASQSDPFCNARFDYIIGITLLTFTSL
jgi:hypothetical protein